MRRAAPLLAACLLLSLPGCFAFDEIDSANDALRGGAAKKEEEKKAQAAAEGEKPGPPTGSQWWSTAKSLGRGPADAEAEDAGDPQALVSCRIAGNTRFMRRGDCLSQGGAPRG